MSNFEFKPIERPGFFEKLIFSGRLILCPRYIGLLGILIVYGVKFFEELYRLIRYFPVLNDSDLVVKILGLVDLVMVANLVVMISLGSYAIFVKKLSIPINSLPRWLHNISAGTLKIKMSSSLLGISSIHLLRDFVSENPVEHETLVRHIAIHLLFIISTIALAYTEKLTHPHPEKH